MMRRIAVAAVMVAAIGTGAGWGQVPVEKTTVWSGKIVLNHAYEVPRGFALRIEPGTVIEIEGYWSTKIVVNGVLEAVGTKEKRIEFRAAKPGYWGGITFVGEKAEGRLEHCLIQNGRRAAITCEGSSPVIRDNELVTDMYGEGWIFCEKGAHPLIEGNTIEGSYASILCEDASPQIKGNTFKKCAVGVVLYGFKPDSARPRIENNTGENCELLLFDQDAPGGDILSKAFESELIPRPIKLLVQADAKQESITVLSRPEGGAGTSRLLAFREGKPVLTAEKPEAGEIKAAPFVQLLPFAARNGKTYQLLIMRSGGGVMGREGCMDTKPAFVLLLSGQGKDAQVVWHSPKFDRGYLVPAVADLDGDGVKELVVATGRWCEGKGQVFVFRQTPAQNPGESAKP